MQCRVLSLFSGFGAKGWGLEVLRCWEIEGSNSRAWGVELLLVWVMFRQKPTRSWFSAVCASI